MVILGTQTWCYKNFLFTVSAAMVNALMRDQKCVPESIFMISSLTKLSLLHHDNIQLQMAILSKLYLPSIWVAGNNEFQTVAQRTTVTCSVYHDFFYHPQGFTSVSLIKK